MNSYDAPGWANPNGGSLGLWDGGSDHNGFALYAVTLPTGAKSAATKFRWRQRREMVSGELALWVLDDVSIDVVVANPAVQLSCPAHPHAHKPSTAQLLTVVAQFSQAVKGFTAADVVVHNGTVVGLSLFNAKILGMGELYSILVRPDGPPTVELYDVVVMVGGGVCVNNRGHANLGSNTLRIAHDARTKKKQGNRIEQALGMPRPGAGSLEEAMAARARVLGDARFAQPLAPGQATPGMAEQIASYTKSMQVRVRRMWFALSHQHATRQCNKSSVRWRGVCLCVPVAAISCVREAERRGCC